LGGKGRQGLGKNIKIIPRPEKRKGRYRLPVRIISSLNRGKRILGGEKVSEGAAKEKGEERDLTQLHDFEG